MTTKLSQKFWALVAREKDGKIAAAVEQADDSLLAEGDVLVRVAYSTINYKDALAVCDKGKILRTLPLIPGIDYVGEVVASDGGEFKPGDSVILTGHAVGEKYSGGFGEYARAQSRWLVPRPAELSTRQAMVCGTAGLTAALCVLALHDSGHVKKGGKVAVSGASGGVGSFAVTLLSRLGYAVSAISRPQAADYLTALGAGEILSREEMSGECRPLEKSRWDGAVDTVGDTVLARLLAETNYGGVVVACGLAAGVGLKTTVMPFILRGVRLDGVDSVMIGRDLRQRAWKFIADTLSTEDYRRIEAGQVNLGGIVEAAAKVLSGDFNGRYVVAPAHE